MKSFELEMNEVSNGLGYFQVDNYLKFSRYIVEYLYRLLIILSFFLCNHYVGLMYVSTSYVFMFLSSRIEWILSSLTPVGPSSFWRTVWFWMQNLALLSEEEIDEIET